MKRDENRRKQKLDALIFLSRGGKNILKTASTKKGTEGSNAISESILEAHQFALSVISEPHLNALYTKLAGGRCSAYSLAISEYLTISRGNWVL